MVDSPRLSLVAPVTAASLPSLAIRRHHPIGKFVPLLQDQNNKSNAIGVCKEEFKVALLHNAQKPAFVQPKAESSSDLVEFMFGLAQQHLQYEKIIQFLSSGSNRRLEEILNISFLSDLMDIQCLAVKDTECLFPSNINFFLHGYENIPPDEFRKEVMKFRDCFQTHQKLCGYSRKYTESIPQFLQSNADVMGWVEPEAYVLLFPDTKNKKQGSVPNISEHLVNNQIKLDKQFALVPHFENSLLGMPSIKYEEKSPETLYGTTKFNEQKVPISDTMQRVKSSVSSPAKLKPKHHLRKKNKKLVKQQRDIFQKSQFQHYEYMFSMLFNNDSATSSVSQLKTINQKEFTMLLNHISVGLTGSGLGITMFVASKMLAVNAFDSRRLMNIMFGIGLLWLSAGVQNLREVVLSITRLSHKLKPEERKIVSRLKRELTGVFFKALTLIAFSLVRFV